MKKISQKKYRFPAVFIALLLGFQIACISTTQNTVVAASKLATPKISVTKRTANSATIKIKKVKGATGYKLYCATKKKGKYKYLATTTKTSYTDSDLSAKKNYYYKVKAYKKGKNKKVYSSFSKIKKAGKIITNETTQAPADQVTESFSDNQKKVLDLVNKARSSAGLDPLKLDTNLCKAAEKRSIEIQSKFQHNRPDGSSCFTILDDMQISYGAAAENIAAGQETPADVMASWLNSEGHKANIMNKNLKKMGISRTTTSNGYHYYWVQLFTD